MAASDAYLSDASLRREAAQKNLTRYRKRAFKQAIARWLFIAGILAIGFAMGITCKSCSAAQAAGDATSSKNPATASSQVVVQPQAVVPPPSPEKWCAAFIRNNGGARAKAHAMETAEAVAACAPLLGPWMDEREATCFIMAVIWKESTFDPFVSGTSRDRGLMQLCEGYHKWRFAGKDWRIPAVNVRAGTGLLVEKMRKYHGAVDKVLMSYNGSMGHPKVYANPVMAKYRKLHAEWTKAGVSAGACASSAQAEPHMDRL